MNFIDREIKTYLGKQFNIEPPKVSNTIKFNFYKLPYIGPFLKGITKACTHLHPVPSTPIQLHLPPSSSFQPPPSSLQHPQQYLNQNIARNLEISPNLG